LQYSITGSDADDDEVARIDAGLGLLLLLLELRFADIELYSTTSVFSDGRRSDDLRLSVAVLLRNPITAGELSMNYGNYYNYLLN